MNKMLIVAAMAALFAAGCRVVEVENKGEEVARDADGKPVLLQDGSIQTVKKGWKVYHNQHWMTTQADTISANVKKDEIAFSMGGLNTQPSSNLVALVDTSLTGVTELTAKIAAAIATSGGSVAAEGGSAAVAALASQAYTAFTSGGGDTTKATVATTNDGTVTVSDGSVCTTCKDGSCTTGACTPSK